MRSIRVLAIVLFCCAFESGCFSASSSAPDAFLLQAYRNVVEAPIRDLDEVEFIKKVHHRAEEYWDRYLKSCGNNLSKAYHKGFVDGFVDYVQAGGTGEPPYLPPFRYRLSPFRSPEGVTLVEDWYAGFRQGAAVAKESGLRQFSYVPLPGPAIPKDLNATELSVVVKSPANSMTPGEGSPWEQPGLLPAPRNIPLIKDPLPSAPPPRPIPQPLGVPNLPGAPGASVQPQFSVPQQAQVRPALSVVQPTVSIPPPELPLPSVQPSVKPAEAVVRPSPPRSTGETDPWHPAATRSPGPGSDSY